jgi:hypothetical protein
LVFGGIADTEYSVLVEADYSAEYSAKTGIRLTTNLHIMSFQKSNIGDKVKGDKLTGDKVTGGQNDRGQSDQKHKMTGGHL